MKTILVIEDEATLREDIVEILMLNDFDVVEACDGEEGLRIAEDKKPDLIVSDIMMPKLDGYGVLEHIRSNPETQTIPFIFLTAKVDRDSQRQGINAGADDYLTKPFTSEELLKAIKTRFQRQSIILSDISRQIDELNLLRQLDQELSQRFSPEWAVTIMMDWALRFTNATVALMGIVDKNHTNLQLEFVYMNHSDSSPQKGDIWSLDNKYISPFLKNMQPILIRDARQHPSHRVINSSSLSVLGMPLISANKVVGLLILESNKPDIFNQSHLDFISQMANRAAIAIEHSHLFQELIQQQQQELELQSIFGRFVSKSVAEAIRNNTTQLKGEKRIVSILFCDIRDFTGFSEKHSPEQVVAMLNEFLPLVVKSAHMNGGIVNKFGGDSTLIIFGAPTPLEHSAYHSILTALQIRSNLKHFNQKRSQNNERSIEIGIGINTGNVVAGIIGASDRQEYTVIGDSVNLASRIQALNKHYPEFDILISDETYKSLNENKNIFNFVDLGKQKIRGKSDQVKVWAVAGLSKSIREAP